MVVGQEGEQQAARGGDTSSGANPASAAGAPSRSSFQRTSCQGVPSGRLRYSSSEACMRQLLGSTASTSRWLLLPLLTPLAPCMPLPPLAWRCRGEESGERGARSALLCAASWAARRNWAHSTQGRHTCRVSPHLQPCLLLRGVPLERIAAAGPSPPPPLPPPEQQAAQQGRGRHDCHRHGHCCDREAAAAATAAGVGGAAGSVEVGGQAKGGAGGADLKGSSLWRQGTQGLVAGLQHDSLQRWQVPPAGGDGATEAVGGQLAARGKRGRQGGREGAGHASAACAHENPCPRRNPAAAEQLPQALTAT